MKKTVLQKRSKSSRATAKRKAWAEFRLFVLNRDNWTCVTCGTKVEGKNAQGGHFLHGVTNMPLWLDERNVSCQCTACNLYLSGNLIKYTLYMQKQYGQAVIDELFALKNADKELGYQNMGTKDYEEIAEKYRELNRSASL